MTAAGPVPSAGYDFTLDPEVYDDDVVRFFGQVASALNDLCERAGRVQPTGMEWGALPPPKSATEPSPKDELSWQNLVVTARDSGQHEQAVEFAKQGVRQHPRSDWLWRELGNELTKLDCLDEAEKALKTARSLNPNADWLWRTLPDCIGSGKTWKGKLTHWQPLTG